MNLSKKLALTALTVSCAYTSSYGMLRHASRIRMLKRQNITKRFCSTHQQTNAAVEKSSGFFWKFFAGVVTGVVGMHKAYGAKIIKSSKPITNGDGITTNYEYAYKIYFPNPTAEFKYYEPVREFIE